MKREKIIMDGNMAAAHVAYAFTECCAIYPITPSSPMADYIDVWSVEGRKNIWKEKVKIIEMQSEGGAAGTFHGMLRAGALASTFTSSQGLLLMLPNMYKIAGELLPGVIHVSARTVATHALSIFGDHSDIYACRQTGFAFLCSSNVQEVMDMAVVAHLSAIEGRVPFVHFFDGFRTSHEISDVYAWNYNDLKMMINNKSVADFKRHSLNPERPSLAGSAQNSDVYFQMREASNRYYDQLPDIVEKYMNEINRLTNSNYHLFDYIGDEDATVVIAAMGSVCETAVETYEYLKDTGVKVGLIKVRLYRPFSVEHFLSVLPETVEVINVLDRTKEPGSAGEPLYLDILSALKKGGSKDERLLKIKVLNGRFGLASKNTTPKDLMSVFFNKEKQNFTIGIKDDVTGTSLGFDLADNNTNSVPDNVISESFNSIDSTNEICKIGKTPYSCKFYGIGADGTVSANKNTIKIIGEHTNLHVQAYFDYDSKKSGGMTTSHLRFGTDVIHSAYLVEKADFVSCHVESYIDKYEIINTVKKGGTLVVNCTWDETEFNRHMTCGEKKYVSENNIKIYIINAYKISHELGLGNRINTILQAVFFALTEIIDIDEAIGYMKEKIEKSYGRRGKDIVSKNFEAIERGIKEYRKVEIVADKENDNEIMTSKQKLNGYNDLPVSAFIDKADGVIEQGTAKYEKRGVSHYIPMWNPDGCIQCNRCAYVCPHAVIRPAILNKSDMTEKPDSMITTEMKAMNDLHFAITVSALDCTGCGVCTTVCPGNIKNDVLVMKNVSDREEKVKIQKNFEFGQIKGDTKTEDEYENIEKKFDRFTVKGSQFVKPYLEYSGACAGCGETPYAKLITQLYGDKMIIANATGCSSIWAGSYPSTPYTFDKNGHGPAWGNSLFEDNAEYGLGLKMAGDICREENCHRIENIIKELEKYMINERYDTVLKDITDDLKAAYKDYKNTYDDTCLNRDSSKKLIKALEQVVTKAEISIDMDKLKKSAINVLDKKEYISKKSYWLLGGDGWAYDIGFGGLDHVLSTKENVNVFVFDTEMYSNTGGQVSKASTQGMSAMFASDGKKTPKKKLAQMMLSYGYVYVAQVSMGADMNQCIRVIKEAEQYNGPSLIIGYSPCINHGIKKGMSQTMKEEELAVKSGYWKLFSYNPQKDYERKTEIIKKLDEDNFNDELIEDFYKGEVRFNKKSLE